MKIAVYGTKNPPEDDITIRNTSDLRSYFIIRELKARGHEIIFKYFKWDIPVFDEKVDHFLCLLNGGGLSRMPKRVNLHPWKTIRKYTKGKIAEISGGINPKNPIHSDLFFTNIPSNHFNPKVRCIGWAADPILCFPSKPHKLTVLVDHTLYHEGQDETPTIIEGLRKAVLRAKIPMNVIQLNNEGTTVLDFTKEIKIEQYKRDASIPYLDACKLYSSAHIFFVTHAESVGHCVIENAMAGALIAMYPGAIKAPLINPLNHVLYTPGDPNSVYRIILDAYNKGVNYNKNRKRALPYNWSDATDKIISALEE
ncbi:MAG TPA: hypothetical protein PLQ68_07880 [Clostridia bacterium]|nr:hypothetical protein [Clostridia bacterium]